MFSGLCCRAGVRGAIAVHHPAVQAKFLDDGGESVGVVTGAAITARETESGPLAVTDAVAVRVLDVVNRLSKAAVGSAISAVRGALLVDCELNRARHFGKNLLGILESRGHAVFGRFGSKLLQVGNGIPGRETNAACVVVGVSI